MKGLRTLILVAGLGLLSIATATEIFTITPNVSSLNVRSDSSTAAQWVVTNNTNTAISDITIPVIDPAGVSVNSTDTCSASTLAPAASCIFNTSIPGSIQASSFQVIPTVCGFNGSVCSKPVTTNRLQVNVVNVAHSAYVYILTTSNTLTPINATTLEIGTPLSSDFNFSLGGGVAVSLDGTKVYFTDAYHSSLDIASGGSAPELLSTLFISESDARNLALSSDGNTVYMADQTGNVDVIDVRDATAPTLVTTISGFVSPIGIAVSPNGEKVYVSDSSTNSVGVINTNSNTLVDSIDVGTGPMGLAVSPDGTRVYVANRLDSTVSVIDTSDNTVIEVVSVAYQPVNVAVTPDGTKVYVTEGAGPVMNGLQSGSVGGGISVINTADYSASILSGFAGLAYGIAASPDGSSIFFTSDAPVGNSLLKPYDFVTNLGGPAVSVTTPPVVNVYVIKVNEGNAISLIPSSPHPVSQMGDFVG